MSCIVKVWIDQLGANPIKQVMGGFDMHMQLIGMLETNVYEK